MKCAEQRGSVLLVTLILLLVLTALAVSSVRDSALETQVMTRDLQQHHLFNAAEAGLRDAERRIARAREPLPACGAPPCVQGLASNNMLDFAQATPYFSGEDRGGMNASVRWYIRLIPSTPAQPRNARYGEAAKATGSYYYEVSSQAFFPALAPSNLNSNCAAGVVCLRSVVARTFIEQQP
ncbi:type IV pilus assembly protein PilX [Pseudomonas sp. TE3786]